MRQRRFGILFGLFMVFELVICVSILRGNAGTELDTVEVNRVTKECEINWDAISQGQGGGPSDTELGYSIIDKDGALLYAAGEKASASLNEAIAHRDTITDIMQQGELVGKVLIYNDSADMQMQNQRRLAGLVGGAAAVMLVIFALYLLLIKRTVFTPFERLKRFASQVANGELDLPLEMDYDNSFGAFTESFDMMREELKVAREQERAANQSKKELVAKLSHDIKTPVASIKAVSELMEVSAVSDKEREQLRIIDTKADQIDSLISNMFQATLEELKELKAQNREHDSCRLRSILVESDYLKKTEIGEVPECLVQFDELRMQQVIDNVIGNSYKYAGTSIKAVFTLETDFMLITIQDFGNGVENHELALLKAKYYRGENAAGKSGTGLGLYISGYLMEEMGGALTCRSGAKGFTVELAVALAGK